jgi:hypothetical protein
MKRDDALWKGLIEDLVDDFLRFYFPDADEILNFERKISFLDKELEQLFPNTQDEFNPKYVDKLIKVFTKSGTEEWILIHVEVQGSTDKNFAKRMFTYYTRIFNKYDKEITALAILTDKNKSFRPSFYRSEFMRTSVFYEFNTYKILDIPVDVLKQNNNPFARVVEVVQTALKKGRIPDEKLFDLKVELVRKLLKSNIEKDKIRVLLRFLKLYIRFENQEFNHTFEQKLDEITNQTTTMGLEEFVLDRAKRMGLKEGREQGIEQGIEQGKDIKEQEKNYNFTKALLLDTDFSEEKIATLVGVDISFVKEVKASLL